MLLTRSTYFVNSCCMKTRIGRNGRQQVLLGTWIDKGVYDEIEGLAGQKSTTIAEITRALLERGVQTEGRRPEAERILEDVLNLTDGEREQLRQQIEAGKKDTRSARNKKRQLAALREQNAKKPLSAMETTPSSKPEFR